MKIKKKDRKKKKKVVSFFFKQKTAYEMRISDWSSDVCSSDLRRVPSQVRLFAAHVDTETKGSPSANVGQIVGGYRIGTFTPYATFSFCKSDGDIRETGLEGMPELADRKSTRLNSSH